MITIYDMTSGTLRKDLEANDEYEQNQSAMIEQTQYQAELKLQEIEFETETPDSMPAHLLDAQADDFLNSMK